MQYDVGRVVEIDVEDWTRTCRLHEEQALVRTGEEGGCVMQLAQQQRQYAGWSALATFSSPTRSSPAHGVVGRGLQGDGRLAAAVVTLYWTSPALADLGPAMGGATG